jgi:hypothetical protein
MSPRDTADVRTALAALRTVVYTNMMLGCLNLILLIVLTCTFILGIWQLCLREEPAMRVIVLAQIPDADLQAFLQLLRTWDTTHPGTELTVAADDATMTMDKARAILEALEPRLPHIAIVDRPEAD